MKLHVSLASKLCSSTVENNDAWADLVKRAAKFGDQSNMVDPTDANKLDDLMEHGGHRLTEREKNLAPYFTKLARIEPKTISVGNPPPSELVSELYQTTSVLLSAITTYEEDWKLASRDPIAAKTRRAKHDKLAALATRLVKTVPGSNDGDDKNLTLADVKDFSGLTAEEVMLVKTELWPLFWTQIAPKQIQYLQTLYENQAEGIVIRLRSQETLRAVTSKGDLCAETERSPLWLEVSAPSGTRVISSNMWKGAVSNLSEVLKVPSTGELVVPLKQDQKNHHGHGLPTFWYNVFKDMQITFVKSNNGGLPNAVDCVALANFPDQTVERKVVQTDFATPVDLIES